MDNHDLDAPFPLADRRLGHRLLGRLFTMLLRGNAAVTDDAPSFKDGDLLTRFGSAHGDGLECIRALVTR